jgi:hypothetical protein
MDFGQKIFIIWQKAEIIPNLLDVAPLVGPPTMKIRVVMFCTLPLVAPSQKSTCFDPSGHLKNGKCIFCVKTEKKTLFAKVVGNAKMHISTKNGTMVPQFAVELAQTMVTWQGRPRELLPGSTLCERVHL